MHRRFRGRDDAIAPVGDRTILEYILKNPSKYSREGINKAIMTCYSGLAYGDANYPKIINEWGSIPRTVTIHGQFAEQHPELAQLNLDAGIMTHLPELMRFLEDNQYSRNAFKQHLGHKIAYRGMMLTEQEAEKAIAEGIDSEFLRNTNTVEELEANVLSVYIDELIEVHFHGENYNTPFISVSGHEDVAIAVGRYFGREPEGKELYLFKLSIPEIDLIYYTQHAIRTPYKLQGLIEHSVGLNVSVNDAKNTHPWDKDTESYIIYKINPTEIIEVSKPIITSVSWNGRKA